MKLPLFSLLGMVLLLSCKNAPTENNTKDYLTSDLPEDFLGFYLKFHSDSVFQMEHIVFPLKMKKDSTDWTAEEWQLHKPFDDHGGLYTQTFLNMNGLIIEHIKENKQVFQVERRFMKSSNGYNLIYYKIDNALEASGEWELDPS